MNSSPFFIWCWQSRIITVWSCTHTTFLLHNHVSGSLKNMDWESPAWRHWRPCFVVKCMTSCYAQPHHLHIAVLWQFWGPPWFSYLPSHFALHRILFCENHLNKNKLFPVPRCFCHILIMYLLGLHVLKRILKLSFKFTSKHFSIKMCTDLQISQINA